MVTPANNHPEDADAFEREAAEPGRSERFLAFLSERSRESGRNSLEEIESRLGRIESLHKGKDAVDQGPVSSREP